MKFSNNNSSSFHLTTNVGGGMMTTTNTSSSRLRAYIRTINFKTTCYYCVTVCVVYVIYQSHAVRNTTTATATTNNNTKPSPLHDKTMTWSWDQPHVWLEYEAQQRQQQQMQQQRHHNNDSTDASSSSSSTQIVKPPYMIVLTNYGWNQKNQVKAKFNARSIRTTELLQGIIDHEYFHPTAYEEIMNGKRTIDPTIRYYVLLDIDTCFESNYPIYRGNYNGNSDTTGWRFRGRKLLMACYRLVDCYFIHDVLAVSPLFNTTVATTAGSSSSSSSSSSTNSNNIVPNDDNKLIVFECRGNGAAWDFRNKLYTTKQLALVTLSSVHNQILIKSGSGDQGLPPPANKPVQLSHEQVQDIMEPTCSHTMDDDNNNNNDIDTKRPYLLSFSGNLQKHPLRSELAKLHNPNEGILITETKDLKKYTDLSYTELLTSSQFAAAPPGDNQFSYRFTEALSAGAIPVLYSDHWILPFIQPTIADWDNCIVKVPSKDLFNATLPTLQAINATRRCQMRQVCYNIYSKYMATSHKIIQGILDGLETVTTKANDL